MRVDLGGGQIGMTEQFLHGTQILTGFEDMRSKGVSHEMRRALDVTP